MVSKLHWGRICSGQGDSGFPLLWNSELDGFCPCAGAEIGGNSNPKGEFFFSWSGGVEDDPTALPANGGTKGGTIVPKVGNAVDCSVWGFVLAADTVTFSGCNGTFGGAGLIFHLLVLQIPVSTLCGFWTKSHVTPR